MGLAPETFDNMTVAQFMYACVGFNEREKNEFRAEWERTRWSTYFLLSIQIRPEDRKEMTQMLPLPWEVTQHASKNMTLDERQARVADMIKK